MCRAGTSPPSMTVSLAEHTASPYLFTATQRYTSVSSPVSLLICREAQGRGRVSASPSSATVRGAQVPQRHLGHRGGGGRRPSSALGGRASWLFRVRPPGPPGPPRPESHPYPVLWAAAPWATCLTCLNLRFSTRTVRVIRSEHSERSGWNGVISATWLAQSPQPGPQLSDKRPSH